MRCCCLDSLQRGKHQVTLAHIHIQIQIFPLRGGGRFANILRLRVCLTFNLRDRIKWLGIYFNAKLSFHRNAIHKLLLRNSWVFLLSFVSTIQLALIPPYHSIFCIIATCCILFSVTMGWLSSRLLARHVLLSSNKLFLFARSCVLTFVSF